MARPESKLEDVVAGYYRGRGLFSAWDVYTLIRHIEVLEATVEKRALKPVPRPEDREVTT